MNDFKPDVLSDTILSEYILKNEIIEQFKLNPHWDSSEGFNDHVILYNIALVLIALLNIERKKPNYYQVRLIFEKAIFTDGNIPYHQVKSVMDKLGEIVDLPSNSKIDNLKEQNEKMPRTMTCLREAKILKNDQAIMCSRASVIGMGWAMAWLREIGIIRGKSSDIIPIILDVDR